MKKILSALVITMAATTTAYAQLEPQPLEFNEVGGGYYIYCNNPEAVDINTLVDGDKPRYVMTNEDLGPGKYYIYASHFNYIGTTTQTVAPAMELDVELNPGKNGCEFTLSNIGFETTNVTSWHENNSWVRYEQDWGMLNTCAKTMQKTIVNIDGEAYYPCGENKVYNVETDKRVWLSEYIPNYNKTHYMQPVHLQAILEIKSGTMDVNICAFKSNDEVGDRSDFREDAEHGIKRHDRCVKGIADTLPQVVAELSYEINDDVTDGTYLPVTMVNPYASDGITLNEWFTNLNPLDDPWAKAQADVTGMIELTYEDDSKLDYYGEDVPKKERDNIWHFDTNHADTHQYESKYTTQKRDTYVPNFKIDASQDSVGFATNLGNYGVTYTYELSIRNDGRKTRYFTYVPTTNSKILVYTNENGEEAEYAFAKPFYANAHRDVMSVVELPPGETTEFSVNVTLPVNYNGGTKNAFIIKDKAEKLNAEAIISKLNQREYKRAINGKYLSEYKDVLPQETLAYFAGNLDAYEIVRFGDRYAVRWCAWDGKYNYYYPGWWLCNHVYILDKDMKVETHRTFNSLPIGSSVSDDMLYIQTAREGNFRSENGMVWEAIGAGELPDCVETEDDVYLGEVLDSYKTDEHTIWFGQGYTITGPQYEAIYNLVKDFKLKRIDESQEGFLIVAIDQANISKGISYNGKYYAIENDLEEEFLFKRLWNIVYNRDDHRLTPCTIIAPSDWAKDGINLASEYGLVPYQFTQMYATDNIKRVQFCNTAINVIKYLGYTRLPEEPKSKFGDTDDYNVRALADLGVITGYENGKFRPNNSITREEAAVIISRMLKLCNLTEQTETEYQDADTIQEWAKDAVNITARYNIMNGIGDNTFSPKGSYTVEQSIITMLRVFNTAVNAGYLNLPDIPEGGNSFVVYREGYRNGRIELAVFDTEADSTLLTGESGEVTVSGSYENDVKYYFSCGRWIEFERGYDKVSNKSDGVLVASIG